MALLDDRDRELLRNYLATVTTPVRLVFFTQTLDCDTCPHTRQILDEVASLNDQITIEEYNLVLEKQKAEEYGIDRAPAIAVVGARDTGIRFLGIPAGYEFMSLVDAIRLASSGTPDLTAENLARLEAVDKPLSMMVFVTPG